MPIVIRAGACLASPPPPVPVIDVPPCEHVESGLVCPPLPPAAEAAIEGYLRRIRSWSEEAWQICGAAPASEPAP